MRPAVGNPAAHKPLGLFLEEWMIGYRKDCRIGLSNDRVGVREG